MDNYEEYLSPKDRSKIEKRDNADKLKRKNPFIFKSQKFWACKKN